MEELKVSVSGSTVHKAVANYIKNDEGLQKIIKEKAEAFLSSDVLKISLEKRLENEFSNMSFSFKDEMKKSVEKAATKEVNKFLTADGYVVCERENQ